jgi:negative regulator of flagellin synthesis FlgM
MKITNSQDKLNQIVHIHEASNLKQTDASEVQDAKFSAGNQSDKVSISSGTKDLQIALDATNTIDDIRFDVVEPIKRAVENGTYKIDPEKIAEKILNLEK